MKKLLILLLSLVVLLSGCGPKVDEETKRLDQVIDAFIENYASDYIKIGENPVLNENVIVAIKALEELGEDVSLNDYVNSADIKAYFDSLEYTSIGVAYKAVIISKAYGVTHEKANAYLESLTEENVDPWNYVYGVLALRNANVNSSLRDVIVNKLNIIREEDYRDADYAGYALIASSGLSIDKAPLFTLIKDNLSKTGVISWGNPNASATASVILGLIADGKNPTDAQYSTDGVNLVEALLQYENQGGFKNLATDTSLDIMFATPQAFSALVSYKLLKEGKPANILLP